MRLSPALARRRCPAPPQRCRRCPVRPPLDARLVDLGRRPRPRARRARAAAPQRRSRGRRRNERADDGTRRRLASMCSRPSDSTSPRSPSARPSEPNAASTTPAVPELSAAATTVARRPAAEEGPEARSEARSSPVRRRDQVGERLGPRRADPVSAGAATRRARGGCPAPHRGSSSARPCHPVRLAR